MNETSFLAANPAASGQDLTRERDISLHRAKPAFFFLLLFTLVIYGRPEDIFPALRSIPLAKISGALTVLSYLVALLPGRAPILRTRELALMLALTGWFVVCLFLSSWKSGSLQYLIDLWLLTFLVFFLLSQTVLSLDRIRKVFWTIIFCGLIVASYYIAQEIDSVVHEGARMEGNHGFFASYYSAVAASVTFPFIAALFILTHSLIKRALLVTMIGLVIAMVVLGAFRSDLLSVSLAIALTWMLVLRRSRPGRLLGVIFAVVVVVALATAPAIFWHRMTTLWSSPDRLTSAASVSAMESKAQREVALRYSILYTLQHPVFGMGPGSFAWVFVADMNQSSAWIGTHNMYTQISSETGIPGLVLFVGLFLAVVRNMRKVSRVASDDPMVGELRLFARATIASTLSFMFAGFFAHVAYDCHFYYVVAISSSLQIIAQRMETASLAPVEKPPIGRFGFRGRPKSGVLGGVTLDR